MLSRSTIGLVVAALVAACSGDEAPLRHGPAELNHSSLEPIKLSGRILSQGDYLGLPTQISAFGSNLLVLDAASDSALHVISAADGRVLRSSGRRGEGPGEYKGAWSIAPDPRHARRAWIYDIALARLTRLDFDSPAAQPAMIQIRGDAVAMHPVWLSDTLIASPGLSERGRLSFFARDGEFRRSAGPLPSSRTEVPPAVLQHAWTGKLISNPRLGLVALVTLHADRIEIYRPDGTLVRNVRGPFGFEPQFTVDVVGDQPVMASGDAMRFGYTSAQATSEHIFALFSGRTREGYGPDSSFGRFVHVYDWNGNLERVIELDTAILSLAISPDHKTLYGIRHNPEPAILAFHLMD